MEYQKIINLLENTPNQPSKFRTKNWVEINVLCSIANQEPTFTRIYTKPYVPAVTLSTQDNAKKLKSGFKRTINWNKYEPKVTVEQRNRYLDFLISSSFRGVSRLFVFYHLKIPVLEQFMRDIIFC